MAASSVTIRVDSDVKEGASRVAEHFGFDLSSVTRAFYLQMIRENRIPLTLSDPEPNDESLAAIKETDEMIRSGKGESFSSGHDLIQAALS
ncbi:type II toxin-antitoxin system RelB/DinJ family antitoxin [Olsenella sp. Marseille-P4559]|jgi:DNA-damage-inducible protein J|uniref:type II toxin-antitoxin system RelB/DinJ family antitoxin n=1 Tax=Olsenella sp. Marseille-P4559 TaxID=2364795 RepID=UPI0010301EEA|nr:type II toxin-antitoxin system RelB/DinJ family antitoxin [Olsenella sp. Marseille-P4559]